MKYVMMGIEGIALIFFFTVLLNVVFGIMYG